MSNTRKTRQCVAYDNERYKLIGKYIRKHCDLNCITVPNLAKAIEINVYNLRGVLGGYKPLSPRSLNRIKALMPSMLEDKEYIREELLLTKQYFPDDPLRLKSEQSLKKRGRKPTIGASPKDGNNDAG